MSVPGPVMGPCEAWIDGDAVADCCTAPAGSAGSEVFTDVAVEASMLLFELSGRQFSGLCESKARPCRNPCSCWGSASSGSSWFWTLGSASGAYWRNECGDRCGCGTEDYILLAGYPVRDIVEVKIDGVVLPSSAYRLDQWRKLIRMADPGPPVVNHRWPGCQNLALNDDQPGTFSITYKHGVAPPLPGVKAAAALACELWKACPGNGGDCKLPSKVTKIVRQGVTVERVTAIADMLRKGSTGIPQVDAFIAAYNPHGVRRRPAVWSPDSRKHARRVGN